MAYFTVRQARQSDNEALVELDRRRAMSEETTLAFDRFPDFFVAPLLVMTRPRGLVL